MRLELPDHKAVSWNKLYEQSHWTKRKQMADKIHKTVWVYCQQQNIKKVKDYPLIIEVKAFYSTKHLRDADNICSKVYLDGLKQAGIIEDDDYRYVKRIEKEIIVGAEDNKVVIKTKEVNDNG